MTDSELSESNLLPVPEPAGARCRPDELRSLFLFEKLTAEQLDWLCVRGRIETFQPGPVYAEGEDANCFFVLIEGTLVLSRRIGNEDVEVNRTSQPGVYAGAWRAFLGDRVPQRYDSSLRVAAPSRFFVLDAARFAELIGDWFPMALHLLEGLFFGIQNTQQAVGQRERLLALGSLSAGLTHELNNPAAAASRATSALRSRVAGMRHKLGTIAAGPWSRTTLETLIRLQEDAVEHVAKAPTLSPLQAADREDELAEWLSAHGISDGWDLAPTFVQAGLDTGWLDSTVTATEPSVLEGAIRWLCYTLETELLMNEIDDSTNRISTLLAAAKQYSQMDRAPYQVIDVHELLDSTLLMMGRKLREGITVVRQYDRSLPRIPAFAAELNQVWTNLIDNAVAAMPEGGTLTITTGLHSERLLVRIADTGSGIPADVQGRIFEPFFTTKAFGEGTGLGLDISWRIVVNKHHGDLQVQSVPGDTRFDVLLPLTSRTTEES